MGIAMTITHRKTYHDNEKYPNWDISPLPYQWGSGVFLSNVTIGSHKPAVGEGDAVKGKPFYGLRRRRSLDSSTPPTSYKAPSVPAKAGTLGCQAASAD